MEIPMPGAARWRGRDLLGLLGLALALAWGWFGDRTILGWIVGYVTNHGGSGEDPVGPMLLAGLGIGLVSALLLRGTWWSLALVPAAVIVGDGLMRLLSPSSSMFFLSLPDAISSVWLVDLGVLPGCVVWLLINRWRARGRSL